MIRDAAGVEEGARLEADVCVVGAGAAGIALALEWIARPFRVLVLESGGRRPDRGGRVPSRDESVGLPCLTPRPSRARCLGGSTALWTGWCRPLDPLDFQARPWVPHSGWPFDRDHLEPFYRRAERLCRVAEGDPWDPSPPPVLESLAGDGRLSVRTFRFSPPVDFGRTYGAELADAAGVKVLVRATALGLERAEGEDRIAAVRVAGPGGRRFRVRASAFVLAAGGIENARLLLLSASRGETAPGDRAGLVGRFFADHPAFWSGSLLQPAGAPSLRPHALEDPRRPAAERPSLPVPALSPAVQREEGLLGCAIHLVSRPRHKAGAAYFAPGTVALLRLADAVARGGPPREPLRRLSRVLRDWRNVGRYVGGAAAHAVSGPVRGRASPRPSEARPATFGLRAYVEPAPDPESRVTLGSGRDRHGQRSARVDFRLGELERRTLERTHELLGHGFRRAGLGDARTFLAPDEGDGGNGTEGTGWPPAFETGKHHMGTTRMHAAPTRGVVDADGRVHGVANLFVTGSSVFPSFGYANPTLTLLALALRLADRLGRELAARPEAPSGEARSGGVRRPADGS